MTIKKETLIALAVAGAVLMMSSGGLFKGRSGLRSAAKAAMWFMTIRRVVNEPEPRALPPDHVDHYRSI